MKKNQLCIKEEDFLTSPTDWHDFVSFVVIKNSRGQWDKKEMPMLVTLDDDATKKFVELLNTDPLPLYVIGHPTLKDEEKKTVVWEVLAMKNDEGVRIYAGGENMRLFLDHHNVFYHSRIDNRGKLMSGTDGLYTKLPTDDCRQPVNG